MPKVLIIDDDKDIAELVSLILRKEKIDSEIITDSLEALTKIEEGKTNYDLILLDIMMPNISGTELCIKIRDKVTLQDEKLIKIQTKIYEKLKGFGSKSYIVRKMAHFSIYALIGISLLLFIYLFSKKLILSSSIALLLSIMYACYDEYRQLSVPGRSGSIKDVFIDSLGALTGITLIFIIILAIKIIVSLFKNLLNREDLSSEEFNN